MVVGDGRSGGWCSSRCRVPRLFAHPPSHTDAGTSAGQRRRRQKRCSQNALPAARSTRTSTGDDATRYAGDDALRTLCLHPSNCLIHDILHLPGRAQTRDRRALQLRIEPPRSNRTPTRSRRRRVPDCCVSCSRYGEKRLSLRRTTAGISPSAAPSPSHSRRASRHWTAAPKRLVSGAALVAESRRGYASPCGIEVRPFPSNRRLVTAAVRAGKRMTPMHGLLDVDVTEANRLLAAHEPALSFTAFVVASVARAAAAHPEVHTYRN